MGKYVEFSNGLAVRLPPPAFRFVKQPSGIIGVLKSAARKWRWTRLTATTS
jgi:hypothetical protein